MADGTPDVTLGTLHDDLVDLKGAIGGIEGAIGGLGGEMSGLKTEMGGVKTEMGGLRADVRELKTIMVTGFASMPTREQSDAMLRILREINRNQGERFIGLDGSLLAVRFETQEALRTQHQLTRQALHAILRGRNNGPAGG